MPADWTAVDRGIPVGTGDARVVDFAGDASALVGPLAEVSSALADGLGRVTADVVSITGLSTRFGGFTPSPQFQGVRIGDDVYLNPLEAVQQAMAQLTAQASTLQGPARKAAIGNMAAE